MGRRRCSVPSGPPVNPVKGQKYQRHTDITAMSGNQTADPLHVILFTACYQGWTGSRGRTSWMSTWPGTDLLQHVGDAQAQLRGRPSAGQVRVTALNETWKWSSISSRVGSMKSSVTDIKKWNTHLPYNLLSVLITMCFKHNLFRFAITQPTPTAVPTAHSGWWMARAGGVSSFLYWWGVRVGLHGRSVPWGKLWGPAHPILLQFGERHTPDSGGDNPHFIITKAARHTQM